MGNNGFAYNVAKKYIELPNGIPSLSTIGRLFNIISPKQFEKCFVKWMEDAVTLAKNDIISIDGKTMRGSIETGETKGIHIVSAICNSHSLVIGQVKTAEKSNEITAIPELLDMLFIEDSKFLIKLQTFHLFPVFLQIISSSFSFYGIKPASTSSKI